VFHLVLGEADVVHLASSCPQPANGENLSQDNCGLDDVILSNVKHLVNSTKVKIS
jgi:hypothetical protein